LSSFLFIAAAILINVLVHLRFRKQGEPRPLNPRFLLRNWSLLGCVALTGIFIGGAFGMAVPVVADSILGFDWGSMGSEYREFAYVVGMLAGIVCGFAISGLFAVVMAFRTRGACGFGFAFGHLLIVVTGAFIGLGIAIIALYCIVPTNRIDGVKGGSWGLFGVLFGALVALPVALVLMYVNWHRWNRPPSLPTLDLQRPDNSASEPNPSGTGITPREDGLREESPE
jgi:hypothetical protein